MLLEVPELFMAQEDGGLPAILNAGSASGESGVSVLSAHFKGAMHVSATSRQRHHVFFNLSEQSRYRCHIAGRSLSHEPPAEFADESRLSRWVRLVHGVSPTQLAA